MRKAKTLATFGAAALMTPAALATSTLTVYTSINGGNFVAGNQPALPGNSVRVRYVCQTDNPLPVGFAGFNFSPTVGAWRSGDDVLAPWSTSAASAATTPGVNGPGVRDHVNGNGRLAPFAASTATTRPTSSVNAGQLRIRGTGADGHVAIVQRFPTQSLNDNGSYFSRANPVPVFQFTFRIGFGHAADDVLPIGAVFPTRTGGMYWWTSMSVGSSINEGPPVFAPASITIVPAPAAPLLLAAAAPFAQRRRR